MPGPLGPNSLFHSHLPPFFFRLIYPTLPFSLIKELKIQLTTLMIREPKTADQKPYISNPEITPEAILSKRAFMIKVKSPKVRIFMGSVRRIRMGRKKAFKIPKMAAAKKAEKKFLTCIPAIMYEANMMATVNISHLTRIPFILVSPGKVLEVECAW